MQKLSDFSSLILFGARGRGKSTLLRAEEEDSYRRDPDEPSKQIERNKKTQFI